MGNAVHKLGINLMSHTAACLSGCRGFDIGEASKDQVKILAVTSCPTGIAHTYMAAEGIEKAAKAQNCFIKVETRGSGGAKNVLTAKEIEENLLFLQPIMHSYPPSIRQ